MKKFALLCLLLPALLLSACATKQKEPVGYPCEVAPRLKHKWYNSDFKYKMRHEGVLQFGDQTIPMTGLMQLDTETGTARVAILAAMGLKMVVLDVTKADHHVLFAGPIAQKIPGFIDGAARSIRAIFLTPFPGWPDSCSEVDRVQHHVEENPDGEIRYQMARGSWELLSKQSDDWEITYRNSAIKGITIMDTWTKTEQSVLLPHAIEYRDEAGRFTISLQLISAELQ